MKSESTYNATSALVSLIIPVLFVLWIAFVETNIDGTPDDGVRNAIPLLILLGLLAYVLLFIAFRLIGIKQYSYEKVSLKLCFVVSLILALPVPLFMFYGATSTKSEFVPLTVTEAIPLFLVWYIPLFFSLVLGFIYQYFQIKSHKETSKIVPER